MEEKNLHLDISSNYKMLDHSWLMILFVQNVFAHSTLPASKLASLSVFAQNIFSVNSLPSEVTNLQHESAFGGN